jgi:hypothetical protein
MVTTGGVMSTVSDWVSVPTLPTVSVATAVTV